MKTSLMTAISLALLAGTVCGCKSDSTKMADNRESNQNNAARYGDSQGMGWSSPDARILSILHTKNQEEIQAGRLAQQRGASESTRRYGEQLVRDHTANDERVMSVAKSSNITLMPSAKVMQMVQSEKTGSSTTPPPDPLTELRSMNGADFDRAFMQKMQDGHRELISMVESAQSNVHDRGVRDLLSSTLPTLRQHEQMAMDKPMSDMR